MVYRRTEKDAPAYDYEMELARKDGIEFSWQSAPIGILSEDGTARLGLALRANGRFARAFRDPCDMVIKAVGQTKMRTFFPTSPAVDTDEKGRVKVNDSMQTSNPKVFAGGDCANGGAEAVDAAQMGKLAAMGIHESLTGEKVEFAGAFVREPPKAPVDPNPH